MWWLWMAAARGTRIGRVVVNRIEIHGITVENEGIDVTTMRGPRKPDPDWEYTDKVGRKHRWLLCADGSWILPTLILKTEERSEQYCNECGRMLPEEDQPTPRSWYETDIGEMVEPGYCIECDPGPWRKFVEGQRSWHGTYSLLLEREAEMKLVEFNLRDCDWIIEPDVIISGKARMTSMVIESCGDGRIYQKGDFEGIGDIQMISKEVARG